MLYEQFLADKTNPQLSTVNTHLKARSSVHQRDSKSSKLFRLLGAQADDTLAPPPRSYDRLIGHFEEAMTIHEHILGCQFN